MKTVIITGADGGIGKYLTSTLAKEGFNIVMGCKDRERGNIVCEQIVQQTACSNIEVMEIDLSSPDSVSDFVKEVNSKYSQIDILLNNAGVLCRKAKKTKENVEYTVAVNYLGAYILTEQLFPLMSNGAKIINTVSLMLRYGKINSEFLSYNSSRFNGFAVYSHSKLALYYAALEWAEKWKDKGITVNCVDPGIVNTKIICMGNKIIDKLCDLFFRPLIRTPKQGADTILYLTKENNVTGKLFKSRKIKKVPSCVNDAIQMESLKNQTKDFMAKHINPE